MLLARAFVFSLSSRAALAVAALALSVTFSLVAGGAVSGIGAEGATYDEARSNPGHAVFEPNFEAAPRSSFPAGGVLVDWVQWTNGTKLATVDPWPLAGPVAVLGPYAGAAELRAAKLTGMTIENASLPYAPLDALVLPLVNFSAFAPDRAGMARVGFVPGPSDPGPGQESIPWRGVALYFEQGAAQIANGLAALVLVTGAVATLLSSGLVFMEVAARSRDLATVRALAGPTVMRRLIVMRTLVLVAAGLVVGTAVALVMLRLAQAAIPGVGGSIPIAHLVATWLVVGVGASTAGSLAGLRAGRMVTLRSAGSKAITVRRFRGPISFLLVTPRLFAGVVAASAVTVAILGVVVATTEIPNQIFSGADESEIYIAEGEGNPLRGTVDRFLATNAGVMDEVMVALPETYAPTTWQGQPVMFKGTDFERWIAYTGPKLRAGEWPAAPGEATVGIVKARTAGINIGLELVVPASYRIGVEAIRVVGIHATGGIEDDQFFVDLDTAGKLAGLPANKVTGMRAKLVDPETHWQDIAPTGLQITALQLTPEGPVALTPAVATFSATNFSPQAQSRSASLRVNGAVEETVHISLGGHSSETFRIPFTVPDTPRVVVEVNPTTETSTAQGTLLFDAPAVARPGVPFPVRVQGQAGRAIEGAEILVDGVPSTATSDDGRASLSIPDARLATISVQSPQGSGGILLRVAPSEWDAVAHLVAERIDASPPSAHNETHFAVDVRVTIINLGGAEFQGIVNWTADGAVQDNRSVGLASARRAPFQAQVTLPYPGGDVAVLGEVRAVQATRAAADGNPEPGEAVVAAPQTIEDVLASKRAAALAAREVDEDRTSTFLSQVFAKVQDAAVVIVLVTVAHGGTLVWVSVLREIRERDSVVRLLKDLGADTDQVRRRAFRDVLLSVIPALIVGLGGAAIVVALAARYGFPAAFGHTLPMGAWGLFVRTGLALLGVAVAAAAYGVHMAAVPGAISVRRRPLRELLEANQ